MAGMTNLGKQRILEWATGRVANPAAVYVHLITAAAAPSADTNDASTFTQASNHPAAGATLSTNSTDFDASGLNAGSDYGYVQAKDFSLTANGGTMTGRYLVVTDNATWAAITEVYAYSDLAENKSVSDGQAMTFQNFELRITEA